MFQLYYKFHFCYIFLQSDKNALISAKFVDKALNLGAEKSCEVLKFATHELDLYFAGKLRNFATPLKINGTAFQRRVYEALREIPYGQIATYTDIARKIISQSAENSTFETKKNLSKNYRNLALKNEINLSKKLKNKSNLSENCMNLALKNDRNLSEKLKNKSNLSENCINLTLKSERNLPTRAVGNANAKNSLAIFIPCHRVVAKNGLGGYSISKDLRENLRLNPLDIKRFLLNLEGADFSQ